MCRSGPPLIYNALRSVDLDQVDTTPVRAKHLESNIRQGNGFPPRRQVTETLQQQTTHSIEFVITEIVPKASLKSSICMIALTTNSVSP